MKKNKSQIKFFLKSNDTNTQYKKVNSTKNSISKNFKFNSPKRKNNLENQINKISKKVEQARINLGILIERLNQRKKELNKIKGNPISNKSSEKKEKKSYIALKDNSSRRYDAPIKRKIGKEREMIEAKNKRDKEKEKNENEFKRLGEEIDQLVEENKELKKDIQAKRKQKVELEKLKEKMKIENKAKENKLNDILIRNRNLEKSIKSNDYKKEAYEGELQEKNFSLVRDELEKEYAKVIQEYIKREREDLKQKEFRRQVAELRNRGGYDKKISKKYKNEEVLKELKRIEDDKISDRIPILDECLQKWREVNKEKKESIIKYKKNCTKIREAFENLAIHLDLNSISYLPEVFQKTEQRESNINFQLEKVENELDKLELEKNELSEQIELLKSKRNGIAAYKSKFLEQKKENIKIIENITNILSKNINIREHFFQRIQPETDIFLTKLNNTYLSDFVNNKIEINTNKKYNYKTVNDYLSNVEDYFNLVEDWKGNNNTENFDMIEKQNFDKLREDMKKKLEGFESKRIINNSLYNSMDIERKRGKDLNEVIKNASNSILGEVKTTKNFRNNKIKFNINNSKINKNNKSIGYSQDITEDENCRYANDSQAYQQSSIYYPNNTSRLYNKNKNH